MLVKEILDLPIDEALLYFIAIMIIIRIFKK